MALCSTTQTHTISATMYLHTFPALITKSDQLPQLKVRCLTGSTGLQRQHG
jgi:hypothetical protein